MISAYDCMLRFYIVCLISDMSLDSCVLIFGISPLSIDYIGFKANFLSVFHVCLVVVWLTIYQVILNFAFFFFNFYMYLESSVSFSYISAVK